MNRIGLRHPISEALAALPPGIARRVNCDWLTGRDPVFVDLHRYVAKEGGAYSETAHCAFTIHQGHMARADRVPTVVLPNEPRPSTVRTIIHELGHVLDEAIGFDHHVPDPVSEYAATTPWEAFACAFELWVRRDNLQPWDAYRYEVLRRDHKTLRLFEELAV